MQALNVNKLCFPFSSSHPESIKPNLMVIEEDDEPSTRSPSSPPTPDQQATSRTPTTSIDISPSTLIKPLIIHQDIKGEQEEEDDDENGGEKSEEDDEVDELMPDNLLKGSSEQVNEGKTH